MIVTTTTPCFERLCPLYWGSEPEPSAKAPPCIHTITGSFSDEVFAGVQTFR